MVKVLFVYVNPLRIPYIDLGIASLSAYLKERSVETGLVDFTFGLKEKKALSVMKSFAPDIVCFSSRSGEYDDVKKMARLFRKNHKALYVCGGIHPTVFPEEVINSKVFDALCIGEGEEALYELAGKISRKKNYFSVQNFWFRKGAEIVRNPVRSLIKDLDALPIIDYDLFDMNQYLTVRYGQVDYVSARGCPFQCAYCINHFLIKKYKGKGVYARTKSGKKIIDELKLLKSKYPKIRSVKIADELFIINNERLDYLGKHYNKEIGLPFECDVRADFCTDNKIKLLKMMGCSKLNIAIESGDEKLRYELLKKRISDEHIINAFKYARKYGIPTMSFNIIGFPDETKEQIEKTINLNKIVKPDSIQVTIFTPFKGTDLYNYCRENNLLKTEDIELSYYFGDYLRNDNLTNNELQYYAKHFTFLCYKDRNIVKAYMLLLREYAVPYFLKLGKYIPNWFKKIIYFLFWNVPFLRFMSK
ncbi:hypothetical protein COS64_00430 [archaeon CG06_land_8_20_14_3_00_37_11]|nr:MAG: hypothetical protein COS64_00430 [archaeon CG06_land_8_20_14_3_00_37_11]